MEEILKEARLVKAELDEGELAELIALLRKGREEP